MDTQAIAAMETCTRASDAEEMAFPRIVELLIEAGVERYHADLARHEKTYYLPGGQSHVTPCAEIGVPIARAFDGAGVAAAIRASQAGEIGYRSFLRRIAAAGCAGYIVSIAGRRAVYLGRTAEPHVEHFPGAS